MRPELLGQRDELVGEDQAARRVPPAHQRLDAGDGARRERRPWAGSAARARRRRSPWRSAPSRPSRFGRVAVPVGGVDSTPVRSSLATYIAMSARWSSCSTSVPCVGVRARCRRWPRARASMPSSCERLGSAARMRSATSSAAARVADRRAAARRTRRRRAGRPMSSGRTAVAQPLGRRCCSSWSPAWWPRVSLTSLNRSRSSRNSADATAGPRRSSERGLERARRRSLRLGSPVSASWLAWCSRSSARPAVA